MRKNCKRSNKMSVDMSRSVHFASVILMLFVMVIVNMLATSRCDQMLKAIGEKETQLAKLEKDREREEGRWAKINTPENLDHVLTKLGMSMKYPRAEQVIRMDAQGVPEPGQISIARIARRRSEKAAIANSRPATGTSRRRH